MINLLYTSKLSIKEKCLSSGVLHLDASPCSVKFYLESEFLFICESGQSLGKMCERVCLLVLNGKSYTISFRDSILN